MAPAEDARPARCLLRIDPQLERRLLAHIADPEQVARLEAIDWSEAAERALLPAWREQTDELSAVLSGLTPATIPTDRDELVRLGRVTTGAELPDQLEPPLAAALRQHAMSAIATATCVALADAGWPGPARSASR